MNPRDHLVHLAPLPQALRAAPFTTAMARDAGLDRYQLGALVLAGALAHPMRGVFCSPLLPDSLDLRIACLRLVLPSGFVVTDRSAGWLWGAPMILAPGEHLTTPAVSAYGPPGRRLRNGLARSGERGLAPGDITEIGGLAVTTAKRTACDLGRLLHRDQALGALDALLGLGSFGVEELVQETRRFRGYRGAVQLRALAPLADARSQSPQESLLRLRWYDCGLPRPECQVEVPAPDGGSFFIDIGLPEEKLGAEYDGALFHGAESSDHDERRRAWLARPGQWLLVVARAEHVHGPRQDISVRLTTAYRLRGTRYGVL